MALGSTQPLTEMSTRNLPGGKGRLAEKTKHMLLSRHQNAGQNHDIKIANRCFEYVVQFRLLGTTIINQNLIQEKIKWRLNSDNARYPSVQNFWSFRLLSKILKLEHIKL
jgi:hypothetical protein